MRSIPFIVVGVMVAVLLWWALRRSEAPGRLICRWLVSAAAIGGIWYLFHRFFQPTGSSVGGFAPAFMLALGAAVCGVVLALLWTRSIVDWLISPFTRMFYDEGEEADRVPAYAIAEAHRKRGRYAEAIQVVEQQLEQFPGDLQGTMLLAEIQAVNIKDLPAAERILEELIESHSTAPASRIAALNQLADWRLSLGHDLEGARTALERIRQLYPDSEADFMASQRLAHLTRPEMVAEHETPTTIPYVEFPLPARVGDPVVVRPKETEPGQEAAELVAHLEQYPDDTDARERLATLHAEHYHRLDLARSELEELIALKHAPRRKTVHWLNRLADLEIHVAGDGDAAHAALQRIVDAYPKSAAAELALRRIALLGRELRAHKGREYPDEANRRGEPTVGFDTTLFRARADSSRNWTERFRSRRGAVLSLPSTATSQP